MNKIIEAITRLISDNVIYSAIIVLFVVGVVFCIIPVIRNIFELKKAIAIVKKDGRKVLDGKLFAGRWLERCWESFRIENEKLMKSETHCEISTFINDRNVITIPERSQFSDILPGIFTSLGILGTFIGLTAGISGIDFASSEKMKDSIGLLLNGMDVAFRTSIVGVIFAIIYNLLRRHINSVAQSKTREFVQLCDSTLYDSFSPDNEMLSVMRGMLDHQARLAEVIRNELVDALHTELQPQFKAIEGAISASANKNALMQTGALARLEENQKRLGEAVTVAINEGLNNTLKDSFVPAMDELRTAFSVFATTSEQRQSESLSKMVDKFAEVTNMLMNDQIRALSAAIDQTCEMQHKQYELQTQQHELISNMIDALRRSMDDVTSIEQVYRTTIENFSSYAQSAAETQKSMQDFAERITQRFSTLLGELTARDAQLKTNLEAFNSGMKSFGDYSVGMSESIEALRDGLHASMNEMAVSLKTLMEAGIQQSTATRDIMSETTNEIQRIVQNGISGLDTSIQQVFTSSMQQSKTIENEIRTRFAAIIECLESVGESLDNNSRVVSKQMIEASVKMRESFDDFAESIASGLGQSFSGFDKAMSEAVSHLLQVLDGMQESIEDIPKGIRVHSESYLSEMQTVFSEMKEVIDSIPNSIRTHTESYMAEMDKVMKEVQTLIEEYESKRRNRPWGNR